MHLEDYKRAIIKQILDYEVNPSEPGDESWNLGIHRAVEAVEETEYVNK